MQRYANLRNPPPPGPVSRRLKARFVENNRYRENGGQRTDPPYLLKSGDSDKAVLKHTRSKRFTRLYITGNSRPITTGVTDVLRIL